MRMKRPTSRARWKTFLVVSCFVAPTACAEDTTPPAAQLACGEGTEEIMGLCVPQELSSQPTVDSVSIEQFDISSGPYAINYPVDISATVSAVGDSFDSDMVVGFKSDTAQTGCLLGGFAVEHDATQPTATRVSQTYQIPEECEPLVDQSDVEVFFAFDLFHTVDLVGRDENAIENLPESLGLIDQAFNSLIPMTDCTNERGQACATSFDLEPTPGLDLRITGLSVDSTVLILPLSRDEGEDLTAEELMQNNIDLGVEDEGVPSQASAVDVAQKPESPHLNAAVLVQVDGLAEEEELPGRAFLTYGIRPLPGSAGIETLGEKDRLWKALYSEQDTADSPVFFEDAEIRDIVGGYERGKASAVFIRDGLDDQLDSGGAWMSINEFELRVCVSLEEEDINPDNNCATQDIIILRNPYGPDGRPMGLSDGTGQASSCGATGTSCDRFMGGPDWSSDTFSSAVKTKIWKEQGNSRNEAELEIGEKGFMAEGAGNWFEAGFETKASFKGRNFTLVDLYLSAVHNRDANDKAHFGFTLVGQDIVPDTTLSWGSATLTLSDILAFASSQTGTEYSTTFTLRYPIVGVSTSVKCGGVSAGVFADLEVGIDPDETSATVSTIEPQANPCEGKTVVDGLCYEYVDMGVGKTFFDYEDHCQALGGNPAAIRTADDHAAIIAARGDAIPAGWVGSFLRKGTLVNGPIIGSGSKFDEHWKFREPEGQNTAQGLPFIDFHPERTEVANTFISANNVSRLNDDYGLVLVSNQSEQYRAWPAATTTRRYGFCSFVDGTGTAVGTRLNATITPFADAAISAELSMNWRFVSWTIGVTLSLVNIAVPIRADLDLLLSTLGDAIARFEANIDLTVTVLRGKIYFQIRYKNFWGRTKTYSKDLARWDGLNLGTFNLMKRGPFTKAF